MRLLACCFILLNFILSHGKPSQEPLILLPTAIRWQSENSITVIPRSWDNSDIPLKIEVFVFAKDSPLSLSEELFSENRVIHDLGAAQTFTFNSSHRPDAIEYDIRVSVTGHRNYSVILPGIANVKAILIQTDKGFYKPGERVNIRILPIDAQNEIYSSDLKVSLVNPQGFNVLSNFVNTSAGFIRTEFDIPEFAPQGFWSIVAKPINASVPWMFSNTRIKVQDYVLPKFFISMAVLETDNVNEAKLSVQARYFHGHPVKGSVFVVCGTQTQILSGNLVDGSWEDQGDISGCLAGAQNGIVRLTATVTDTDNDKNIAIREFQPRAPSFQMVPDRPFFDSSTKIVKIQFKELDSAVIGDKIECVYQCVSRSAELNGLNSSFSSVVGGTINIQTFQNCVVLIIRAFRVVGTRKSDEIFLVIPGISKTDELKLSLIKPPKKMSYKVGETFEASTASLMNYAVICNKKELVHQGTVTINGIINFPIEKTMEGYCNLFVFGSIPGKQRVQSDLAIFFVEASSCSEKYSLETSTSVLRPPARVNITAKAPMDSLAVIQGIDEKLHHMVNSIQAPKPRYYWDLTVFNEPSREQNAPRLTKFLDTVKVLHNIREACGDAGKRGPSNPFFYLATIDEISDISSFCIREYNRSTIADSRPLSHLKTGGEQVMVANIANILAKPKVTNKLRVHEDISISHNDAMIKSQAENEMADKLFLRTYFPEVWFFDDVSFGPKTEMTIHLDSPHSFGKWLFSSTFWTKGEPVACAAKPLTIETQRHVFMEVDLPTQVYENETIQARVIVNGDNFGEEKKLAVCFTSLSPIVCADMGSHGLRAETEYTRVVLNQTQKRSEKFVYLKFLKEGIQNVSFDLKEELDVVGGDTNHCVDPNAKTFDKIMVTVNVKKRLDQYEHFRQINIYPQRKVYNQVAADNPNTADMSPQDRINSIRFVQTPINDEEIETSVEVEQSLQVLTTFVEFAEYQPNYPLGIASEEIKTSRRKKRSTSDHSLPSVLTQYAHTTYLQRQSQLNGYENLSPINGNLLNSLQTLRSDLLEFSNCSYAGHPCAFGEFKAPGPDSPPSLLYTATVTSLMCEENVEDQYVCGLLHFLANASNNIDSYNLDLPGQIGFATRIESTWFMRAILKQTFLDCRMRECMKSRTMKTIDRTLGESFYDLDRTVNYDIRVEAAVAAVANPFIASMFRTRVLQRADTSQMPYWHVTPAIEDDVDDSVIKSMDITANSLALLAFVNQSVEVYDHYRSQFNLPRLAEWIIEEQTQTGEFQTAIDTFYAWRALFRYNERRHGPSEVKNIQIQLQEVGMPVRQYSNKDMPFSLQLPSTSKKFTIHTTGEGRVVMGVRVLASPRYRGKREEKKEPPISITTQQNRVALTDNYVVQIVCIKTKSKLIETLEVEHNLYTGFTTDFSKFQLLQNTTWVTLIGHKRANVGGIYFVMSGITPDSPACYQLVIREPVASYTPEYLAPVTINAKYNQISGQVVLYASDIRTMIQLRHKRRHSSSGRAKRAGAIVGADLVETVCLNDGSCTCSELSCSAKCLSCARRNSGSKLIEELKAQIQSPDNFGILATHVGSTTIVYKNENYTRALMNVGYSIDRNLIFGCAPKIDQFALLIRGCNTRACSKLLDNKLYFLVGSRKGFFEDTITTVDESHANSTQIIMKNYLLRDEDRLEGGISYEGDDEQTTCHALIKELLVLRIGCK